MNPLTATFTQKDTYEGHIYNPVTQNAYMYTRGNPVKYADPSGRDGTLTEQIETVAIMGVLTGILTVSYHNLIVPFAQAAYDVSEYRLKSAENTAKMVSTILKKSITDEWEILQAPGKVSDTIIEGIPSVPREVAVETFPGAVREAWTESFPAYERQGNTIELGPQAIERDFRDNIVEMESETGTYTVPNGGGVTATIELNGKIIKFGHGGRHLQGTGLDINKVNQILAAEVSVLDIGIGQFHKSQVVIDGITIEYTSYGVSDRVINVGTYYPKE